MKESNLLINASKKEMMEEIKRLRDIEYHLGRKLFYKDKKLKAILDALFREEDLGRA